MATDERRDLFTLIGGEAGLRRFIDRFIDRVFDDVMIGYLFHAASRERVKQKEFEHAAEHLGAPIAYSGRVLSEAHGRHRIRGGQFMRRIQILRETMAELDIPEPVREHFIAHNLALQSQITNDEGGVCDPTRSPAETGKR
jgi:truncated hemoglobin YjbI